MSSLFTPGIVSGLSARRSSVVQLKLAQDCFLTGQPDAFFEHAVGHEASGFKLTHHP
jgi:hypothetical protein